MEKKENGAPIFEEGNLGNPETTVWREVPIEFKDNSANEGKVSIMLGKVREDLGTVEENVSRPTDVGEGTSFNPSKPKPRSGLGGFFRKIGAFVGLVGALTAGEGKLAHGADALAREGKTQSPRAVKKIKKAEPVEGVEALNVPVFIKTGVTNVSPEVLNTATNAPEPVFVYPEQKIWEPKTPEEKAKRQMAIERLKKEGVWKEPNSRVSPRTTIPATPEIQNRQSNPPARLGRSSGHR